MIGVETEHLWVSRGQWSLQGGRLQLIHSFNHCFIEHVLQAKQRAIGYHSGDTMVSGADMTSLLLTRVLWGDIG